MKILNLLLLLLIPALPGRAALLKVGPGEAYATIQAAVNAAAAGDTVRVAPGLYAENVVVNTSPLSIEGAQRNVTARGRVTGAPNAIQESVVHPPTGSAFTFSSNEGAITLAGFSCVAAPGPDDAVIRSSAVGTTSLTLLNNYVGVLAGSSGGALLLEADGENATISGNVFKAAPESLSAVRLGASARFHGLHFLDNLVTREGGAAHSGFATGGNRNVGASELRQAIISGNEFSGHAVGFDAGARSLLNVDIVDNQFTSNLGGFSGGPSDSLLRHNHFNGNTVYGLRLTALTDHNDSAFGAQSNLIEDNEFRDNGTTTDPAGFGDLLLDEQADSNLASNTIVRNRFKSSVAIYNNEGAGVVSLAKNYWGAPDGPGGQGSGSGGQILGSGLVHYSPFFIDSALLKLSLGGLPLNGSLHLENRETLEGSHLQLSPSAVLTVGEGASVSTDHLDLQNGSSVNVHGGSLETEKLTLQAGAVLDVISGKLSLAPLGAGQFHTISGTFTFFDSGGSIHINGNTTFSGNTFGLVSDIHVAPGVTLLVLGSLVLDGCTLDSPGNFNVLVNIGSTFKLLRSYVSGAFVTLVGSGAVIQDCTFANTAITVFSTVSGADVFHNILTGGSYVNVLPGASVSLNSEGWGNVNDPALVRNALSLDFRAPLDPTRTLDTGGNLFVQPGDPVLAGLNIGRLNVKAQAAEVLLGYNTDYLSFQSLVPSATWANSLYEAADESAVIGRFNSAIGLGFTFPDPDGSTLDSEIADVQLTAKPHEGQTSFFFRTHSAEDHPLIDTRITASSGGVPYFRNTPFTRNAATLTVDGTIPEFSGSGSAIQVRDSSPLDVTQSGIITRQGTVVVTFDAVDMLAGIDDVDAAVGLSGLAGTVYGTLTGTSIVRISGIDYTRYTFEVPITASVPNGDYNIDATVMDRSGNIAVLAIGSLEVLKNQIGVTVQPQALVAAPVTRTVVFTATGSTGSVLAVWSVPVLFTGGAGTALLAEVPDGTVNLSAKMAWNLRVRLPANLDSNGQGNVAFTGASQLRGGDFNGDNLINLADYNIMRAVFPSFASVPDITGDGQTSLVDYNVFRLNWLTMGDPL